MKQFTVRDAVNATGGRYFGTEAQLDGVIGSASSDSRTVGSGTLFVAYPGTRVDGHDFMADCLKKGAPVCLSQREPKDESEMPCIVVESTLAGVAKLAGWYRRQFDIPVVGITGSVGKTTAKEMIWAVLNQKYRTHKNRMNFNNEISLPLMILEMPEDAQGAILEMGINQFDEMRRLAAMVQPDTMVFTNIGDAHLETLGDRAGVLRAKTEVFETMPENGLAILNGDDEHLRAYRAPVKTITFGMGRHNDFYAKDVENLADEGLRLTICHHGAEFTARVPAFGMHMAYAALMGAAVGWSLGLTDEQIAAGIAAYETVGNRAKLVPANGFTILSDCYNANPNSTASALDSLCTLKGRRVAILGDMLELGPDTLKLHAATGEKAVRAGCDLVVACGELSRATYEGAKNAGGSALHFVDKPQLIEALASFIRKGDVVLVKASHSKAFEHVVDALEKL